MALLATQKPVAAGVVLTYSAATVTTGETFVNSGKEFVHVKNGSGSSITVTFTGGNPCSFGVTNAAHNLVVTVPLTSDRIIGPFSKDQFNDANNLITVVCSAVTTVTMAVLASA